MAPDPSQRLLAAGDLSGSLHLWDLKLEDHTELLGHPGPVELLAWDHTGDRLATVAGEAITVWTVSTGSGEVVVGDEPLHDEHITGIAFRRHGGTLLASTGADGLLVLWGPATTEKPLGRLDLGVELSGCAWRPGTGVIAVGTAAVGIGVVELWPEG